MSAFSNGKQQQKVRERIFSLRVFVNDNNTAAMRGTHSIKYGTFNLLYYLGKKIETKIIF